MDHIDWDQYGWMSQGTGGDGSGNKIIIKIL